MDKLFNMYKCLRRVILPEIAALIVDHLRCHNDIVIFIGIVDTVNKLHEAHHVDYKCDRSQLIIDKCTVEYILPRSDNYKMIKYKIAFVISGDDSKTDCYHLDCKRNLQEAIMKCDDIVIPQTTRSSSNWIYVEKRIDYYGETIISANKHRRRG